MQRMDKLRLRKSMKRNFFNYLALFLIAVMLSGCGSNTSEPIMGTHAPGTPIDQDTGKKVKNDKPLLLIRGIDMANETITLQSLDTGDVVSYPYSLTTKFLDSRGDTSSWSNFYPGRVVTVGDKLKDDKIGTVKLSDRVWEQDNIVRYNVDTTLNMLTIGKSKYHMDADVPVFSNGETANIADVGESDVLRVVGKGKHIVSVSIITGHGMVKLVNTDLFKGTIVEIGTRIFSMITGDGMEIDVPEGKYQLSVANDDGYGGTSEIEVKRGETTVCDLNDWEGEGPKLCNIIFHVSVEGASISIDDKPVQNDTQLQLVYGRHSLKVKADGYEDFSKTLVVNSPTAEIALDMSDENTNKNTSNNSGANSSGTNNSGTNSSGTNSTGTTNSGTNNSSTSNGSTTNKSTNSSTGNTNSGTNYGASGTGKSSNSGTTNKSTNSTSTNKDTTGTDYLTTMAQTLSSLFKTGD